ncbi:proline-rich protein 30 [Liasis olivaceus]
MLTILQNVIPDSCHLLLFLPVAISFVLATIWAFKKVNKILATPHKKKQSKYRVPRITPFEEVGDTSTDPERTRGISSDTEPQSYDNLSLYRTLRILDKKIQYLTWQMQRISKPISRSASISSLDSTTSLYSWAHSSARDACYSQSRTPPSPAPVALQEVPVWQGHLSRPYRTGFQQPHPRSSSYPPMDFQLHQKQKQWGRTTRQSESLIKLIPRVPSTVRSSPIHIQQFGGRIYFLDYKEQELLDWHIHKKHGQKEAPLLHWQKEAPSLHWQKEAPPFHWQKEAPPFHWQQEAPPLHRQKEAPLFSRVPSRETKMQVGIIPQNEVMHWVNQQLSTGQRSRSHTPPSASPKGRQTPPKPPPARVRSPGPCTCPPAPSPKDLLPPPLIICQTSSHSSLKALTDGNLRNMTPKEELTEVLSLLEPNKSLLTKQPGRPGTPKEKEKGVRSSGSSRRPSTPKESTGRPGSPKDKPAEIQVSLMLDRKTHRLSWADNMIEVPKVSKEPPTTAQPSFLDPTFMCQNQLELPCIHAAQVDLHQESLKLAKNPPKPQCLAHAIVESLDTEQAIRDLHMCLAKGLENGHSRPSVEYPVCLLCGRCTPYCPHPHPRHGPCLLVYPRLSVQEGEVYMSLGFLLKIKRHEASKWGLVQGKDASKLQLSKEHPSKQERNQSRSRSRNRNAHETAPPSQAPEKSSRLAKQRSAEAIDPRAREHRVGSRHSGATLTPKPTPRSSKKEPQSRILKPAPGAVEAVQPSRPQKPPGILKKLLLCIRKAWARVRGKKLPSTKQSSRASLQKSAPQNLVVPSTTSDSQAKAGILLNKQDSLPKDATTPTHSKQGYPHGHKKVSMKLSEPETFHPRKKADSHRAKSASSGASKKLSRQSPPLQLQRSPSKHPRDKMY